MQLPSQERFHTDRYLGFQLWDRAICVKTSFVNVNCGIIPEVPTVSSTLLKWDVAAYQLKLQTNCIE